MVHNDSRKCISPAALKFVGCIIIWGNLLSPFASLGSYDNAHAATAITSTTGSGNLGTTVTQNTDVHVYGIREGTQIGNNLFHSFNQFSVATGDIAQFQTTTLIPNADLANILGRVTGGNPSSIFGTVDSATYYPNANLFLMNPNGIIFGPHASVNVGGLVTFTTANYLQLADIGIFHADLLLTSVLTSAPVASFGFLGSNPAAIAVQGSILKVATGQSISLVGGNRGFEYIDPDTDSTGFVPGGVTVSGGWLSAPGGQINLVSVASAGEVSAVDFMPSPDMAMGNIRLSEGALLDVSADAAGTVRIRGGEFVVDHAMVSADTVDSDGAAVAIDIKVKDAVSLIQEDLPALTARTSGVGTAGEILVKSGSLAATFSSSEGIQSLIDTHTIGIGQGGNVTIETGPLAVNGNPFAPGYFIDSGTGGEGNGGHVNITAGEALFKSVGLNTGDNTFGGTGSGGNLSIKTTSLRLDTVSFATDSFHARAGALNLKSTGSLVVMGNSFISSVSFLGDNPMTVRADRIHIGEGSTFQSGTFMGNGGSVNMRARIIDLSSGGTVVTQTRGDGNAGNIHLIGDEQVTLSNNPEDAIASGLHTDSFGSLNSGVHGNAGNITITTQRLEITGGARLSSATQTSGRGGDVTIIASDSILMSGERPSDVPDIPSPGLGETRATGIYTRTVGSGLCSGLCGDAGHVSITTGSLTLSDGAVINSGTTNTGQGGNVSVNATDRILISGTLNDGIPGGIFSRTVGQAPDAGTGGNIALTAGQSVTISDGASISASSTGPGSTGDIQINAGNQFAMTNSSVTTEADAAGGGTIKITTNSSGTVQLTNSTISASVLDGTGGGGSVNIDPQYVILLNSQILANAVQGPGGNIFITTNFLLPDANSVISASSQFGVNGTVTIQSPNAPASGQIQPLGKTPLQATSLLNQHCASLADGEFSSFTVAGRDSLPTEPGNWLASPLATLNVGMGLGAKAEGMKAEGERPDIQILSLRQIAPAGFLTQAFAVDWSASCQS